MEEEQIAAERTADAAVIKNECEKALAEVIPYLKESENALKSLKKEDVYQDTMTIYHNNILIELGMRLKQ